MFLTNSDNIFYVKINNPSKTFVLCIKIALENVLCEMEDFKVCFIYKLLFPTTMIITVFSHCRYLRLCPDYVTQALILRRTSIIKQAPDYKKRIAD